MKRLTPEKKADKMIEAHSKEMCWTETDRSENCENRRVIDNCLVSINEIFELLNVLGADRKEMIYWLAVKAELEERWQMLR